MDNTFQPRRAHPGETTMIEIRPPVAVVGAGLAGLTAAHVLTERGYPVTVFDKGREPGGRTSTRREGEFAFDHGCQFCTSQDDRFRRYLDAWAEQGLVSLWPARLAACERGRITALNDNELRWVGVPGMNAMTKHMAGEMDVALAVKITELRPSPRGWQLAAEPVISGAAYEVVICATPAEQAVPLLAPLPILQAAAASVRMQPCWTLMLAFDYELDLSFDAAFLRGGPLVWAANNGSKPGRPGPECWVLHASPSWSREHLGWEADAVADSLTAAFFDACGIKPVPVALARAHRWRYAAPENPRGDGYLWDAAAGIGVCGDWCHSARAEGAFLSGLMLAERILADRPRARTDRR